MENVSVVCIYDIWKDLFVVKIENKTYALELEKKVVKFKI